MFGTLREDWRRLKRGVPGRRFEEVYEARRRRRKGRASQVLWITLAGVLVAAGPVIGLIPGPGGIVVSLAGLALLARELRPVARFLDRSEPALRKAWERARRAWKRS